METLLAARTYYTLASSGHVRSVGANLSPQSGVFWERFALTTADLCICKILWLGMQQVRWLVVCCADFAQVILCWHVESSLAPFVRASIWEEVSALH